MHLNSFYFGHTVWHYSGLKSFKRGLKSYWSWPNDMRINFVSHSPRGFLVSDYIKYLSYLFSLTFYNYRFLQN